MSLMCYEGKYGKSTKGAKVLRVLRCKGAKVLGAKDVKRAQELHLKACTLKLAP